MVNYNSVLDIQFNDEEITEPVTLAEAKDFCKIDISTDETLITSLITAARQMCEAYTGVGFVSHYAIAIINNSNGDMYLPYGPTGEITSITNENGVELVADETYFLSGNDFKRILRPKENNLTIEYVTGYEVLPNVLKTALLNAIYYLYDNRSQSTEDIGPIAKLLLNPFRRV
jgi:uncharacterized phiE125 gp8 family phage protein